MREERKKLSTKNLSGKPKPVVKIDNYKTLDLKTYINTMESQRGIRKRLNKTGNELNLNEYQSFLYRKLVRGLGAYSRDELNKLSLERKAKVIKFHRKALRFINIWKQEVLNVHTNRIFYTLFPNCKLSKLFTEDHQNSVDPEFKCTLSLDDLSISEKFIIDRLIKEKLLPSNFYQLEPKPKNHENTSDCVPQGDSNSSTGIRDLNGNRTIESSTETGSSNA